MSNRTKLTAEKEPRQRPPYARVLDSASSLATRVQAQREQLFKAISVIECCKNASVTKLDVDNSEYMLPAFDTINDLLNSAAGELERIASVCAALGRAIAHESTEPGRGETEVVE